MRQKRQLAIPVLLLLASLFLYLRYGAILTASPNQVIQGYGDGFNAYNLITWHAKYDSTYTAFEGMAYPYGDHVTIAAATPLLSNSLKFLKAIGLDLTDYAVPILHYSILFSYLVCAIFLYLIFSRLALPPWYSIIIAIALTFLSPQSERIFGHLGLAHVYAIPATIYFLMRFDEKPSWSRSICLMLCLLLNSLIQFYFFAIIAFLIGIFYFFTFLKKTKTAGFSQQDFWFYTKHFSIQVLVPFLLFQWWLAQYEVPDRPLKPYGYTIFISYWEGLFLSLRMPYYQWINDHIIKIREVNFEGLAYAGIVAFVVFLRMLYHWLRHFFQQSFFQKLAVIPKEQGLSPTESSLFKGLKEWVYDDADFLRRLFATAFVLVLFSFGLPFVIPKLEFLLDYSGPLKQFRSVGRFSWIFYYVINIIAFTYLYRRFWHKGKWGKVAIGLALAFLIYESWQFNHSRPYAMESIEEWKEGKSFTETTDIDFSKFQTVLPIPYFNVGTDNFSVDLRGYIQQKSLTLSMQTGLPSMASMGNRSSITRAYKLFQAAAEPYRIPTVLNDFKDELPILLMVDTNNLWQYSHLIEATNFLAQKDALRFYEMPLTSFQTRIDNVKQRIQAELQNDTLYALNGFLSTDSIPYFIYKNFDEQSASDQYKGTGALELNISQAQSILKEKLPNAQKGDTWLVSFWCNLKAYPKATTFVKIKEFHPTTNAFLSEEIPQIRNFIPVMDNNYWALFEFPLKIRESGLIEISLFHKDIKNQTFLLDELLIRRGNVHLYNTDNQLVKDNRWYEF